MKVSYLYMICYSYVGMSIVTLTSLGNHILFCAISMQTMSKYLRVDMVGPISCLKWKKINGSLNIDGPNLEWSP